MSLFQPFGKAGKMDKETVNVAVNPHDMRFLRDRTGADTNQEVIADALQLYKAAVLGAMQDETVSLTKEREDGITDITQLELPRGSFAYARGNADVRSIAKGDVEATLKTVAEDTRRATAKERGERTR